MNIFKLFGEISINNDKANKAIDDTTGHAHSASGALAKVGSTAVKAGSFLIKGLAVGAAAAGTALVALTKQAVSYYADYEQLTGGVETLFKDSGAKVMQYATEAYKTAGLSANDYMDTVTSFSASLIKSLKDDTGKAADYANMALVDMSDNANKMGTDMASIQNAYQGFAKQNYTMLDNLKLGYGGTQQEMRRLLSDAQKIQRANGKFVNYSINSFADIVEAIHVVQGEMGITGTTAEEAATTIQGSIGMMKAAWVNFLTGMADSKQDFKSLTTNLVNSVITVANNVVPRLIETVPRLIEGLAAIGQQLATYLPEMVASLLPSLISSIAVLISALVTQIPALLSAIGTAISTAWTNTVWPMIQNLFKAVFGVELPDWETLKANIANGWNNVVWPAIQNFFKANFGIEIPSWEDTKKSISDWWQNVWDGIRNLFKAVFSIFTEDTNGLTVAEKITSWWTKVTTAIGNIFCAIFGVDPEDENNPITKITQWWTGIQKSIANYFSDIFKIFTDESTSTSEKIQKWWEAVVRLVGDIFKATFRLLAPLVEAARKAIQEWWAQVKDGLSLTVGFKLMGETAKNLVKDPVGTLQTAGSVSAETFRKGFFSMFSGGSQGSGGSVGQGFAKGGVFSKPTFFDTRLGRLEVGEAGAEAVAPIDVLKGYVREAVREANNSSEGRNTDAALRELVENLPDMMVNAFAAVKVDVNNREFARLVKAVN